MLHNIANLGGDMYRHASECHGKTLRLRQGHAFLSPVRALCVADVQRNKRTAGEQVDRQYLRNAFFSIRHCSTYSWGFESTFLSPLFVSLPSGIISFLYERTLCIRTRYRAMIDIRSSLPDCQASAVWLRWNVSLPAKYCIDNLINVDHLWLLSVSRPLSRGIDKLECNSVWPRIDGVIA